MAVGDGQRWVVTTWCAVVALNGAPGLAHLLTWRGRVVLVVWRVEVVVGWSLTMMVGGGSD